jgi:DNA repair exonuclease SbcCD ATPase subunit
MKIERLVLHGFGGLRGEVRFDPDRCNLILAPNESGKSTLVEALVTALYGFPEERRSRHRPITRREAFRPWGQGPYQVELEFRVAGAGYSLHRDLAEDSVTLREERTGKDISEEFRVSGGRHEILERLIELGRTEFVRSAVVRQQEVQAVRDSIDITHRLQRFATSQRGDITAGEALQALEHSQARYSGTLLAGPGRVETELQRLEQRLAELESLEQRLEQEHRAAEDNVVAAEHYAAREAELLVQQQHLDYLRLRALVVEMERDLEERQRTAGRLTALNAESGELKSFADFPLDLVGELSELRGKFQELAARIREQRACLETDVRRPLHEVRLSLSSAKGEARLQDEDGAELTALAVRLHDVDSRRAQRSRRLDAERRRLEDEGLDLPQAAEWSGRLEQLDEGQRTLLEGYSEKMLALRTRRAELEDPLLPDAAGHGAGDGLAGSAGSAVLLVVGASLLLAAVWSRPEFTLLLAAAGLGALAGALVLLQRRRSRRAPVDPQVAALDQQMEALTTEVGACASTLGCRGLEETLQRYREASEMRRRTTVLRRLEDEANQTDEEHRSLAAQAAALLGRAGLDAPAGHLLPEAVEGLQEALERHRRLREEEQDLQQRERRGQEELNSLERRLEEVRLRLEEILQQGGVATETEDESRPTASAPGDAAFRRFTEAAAKAERYLRLQQELIPQAETGGATPEWLAQRRREMETLAEEQAGIAQRLDLDPLPEPEHGSAHYVREHREVREELDEVRKQRQAAQENVAGVLQRYRTEIPKLTEERQTLQRAQRRAEQFAESVGLASEVLGALARESYEEWATALNPRCSSILAHLSPGYRDIRFDTRSYPAAPGIRSTWPFAWRCASSSAPEACARRSSWTTCS